MFWRCSVDTWSDSTTGKPCATFCWRRCFNNEFNCRRWLRDWHLQLHTSYISFLLFLWLLIIMDFGNYVYICICTPYIYIYWQVPSICRNPCFQLAWPWRTMTMILALFGGWKRQQYILLTDLDTHVRKCSKHSIFLRDLWALRALASPFLMGKSTINSHFQ